jgi:pilus assembly protein CpaC
MSTEFPRRCRARWNAAGPIAGIAAALCLLAGAATAAETAAHPSRELQPNGARGMIQLASAASAEDVVRSLSMEKGKSVIVFTDYSVTRVSVGDPRVADVVVLRTQEIQIVAKEVGATNVVLWGSGGEIEAAIDLHVGTAFSGAESAIRRVADVSDVHVDSAGSSIVISGSAPDAAAVERVMNIARAQFPDKGAAQIVNLMTVGGDQQVMIDVTVSEINRDDKKGIGTNWATEITRNGDQTWIFSQRIGSLIRPEVTGGHLTNTIFGDAINFLGFAFPIGTGLYELFVQAIDEKGVGKILARPTLVARTGEKARFLSGGEIPIPVASTLDRITIDYKEFGVAVGFTPTVLSDDRIHLDVSTEVSQVDFALGTAATGVVVPGFRTRRASTGIEVGDGQTFAIAGLMRDELVEKVTAYPLLGQIPIAGVFFRVSNWEKQSTELVLLVRPHLVKPLDPQNPPLLPTDYFDEPNWFEFYLMGRAEGFNNKVAAAEPQAGFVGDAGYRLPASPEDDKAEKEAE